MKMMSSATIAAYFSTFFLLAGALELDCDPCIERPSYVIRAIVHGTESSGFWRQVRAAAVQAGRDLRVDLRMGLYEEFDPDRMAADILEAVDPSKAALPDALIVTIPSEAVHEAVATALQRVPVFGLNSGYDVAESLGLLGFVAMDEYAGGVEAARQFLSVKNVTRALFVNHEKGNRALDQRFRGFADTLQRETRNSPKVDELVGNGTAPSDIRSRLVLAMDGCPYDIVLLASSSVIEHATSAFASNGCTLADHLLGTFDTSSAVYDAIAVGKLSFTVSQQQHLQGALSVVMASIYATSGKRLARSAETDYGIYFSGPAVVTLKNLPSDTLQRCEADAFPVCPNTKALDGITESRCECTDRTKIRIGGVVHGPTTDPFWDVIFAQANQAAADMGVELTLDRLKPEATTDVLRSKMANKIVALCREGVDGLFVSVPSADVVAALRECQALRVPVISINSGAEAAANLGVVHHIAQVEYSAGFGAGQRLLAAGMNSGLCLLHERNHPALMDRCRGFEDAIAQSMINTTFIGIVYVPFDNQAGFIDAVEDVMDEEGDWEGVGALLGGAILVDDGISLKGRHPKMLVGSFDTKDEIYKAIDDGLILFGIDQVPFLQGYMPVLLLTWIAYTKQDLFNTFIATGPGFVEEAPTNAELTCEVSLFEVCPEPVKNNLNQLTKVRAVGLTLTAIIFATSICFILWIIWNRNARVVRASQPAFLVMICVGTLIMGSTIIPLSIDDSVASIAGCSRACMAVPWLFSIGFTFVFAALYSKIRRINKLVSGAKSFRRLTVKWMDVMRPFAVLLSLNVISMLIWTLVDPMQWRRSVICGSGDLSSYGFCDLGDTGVSIAMLACVTALMFGALILANVQAYKARNFSTEFSESKYLGIVMIGLLQIGFVGAPLIALVTTNPTASFFVRSAIIFVVCMSILLLIFVPKVSFLREYTRARKRGAGGESHHEQSEVSAGTLSRNTLLRKRYPSVVDGLRITGIEAQREGPSVSMRNIVELERLMKMQGIDSQPFFKEAGIDKEADGALFCAPSKAKKTVIVSLAEEIQDGTQSVGEVSG